MCEHIIVETHYIYELRVVQRFQTAKVTPSHFAIMPFDRPYIISYWSFIVIFVSVLHHFRDIFDRFPKFRDFT